MSNLNHVHSFRMEDREMERLAISRSLMFGIVIVAVKIFSYLLSGSMAVMADMLESLVHNLAVLFAMYCLWMSQKPPDEDHLYGHGKMQFLSAGVEGALVFLAGITIWVNSLLNWIRGYELHDVFNGMILILLAGIINGVLGGYLIYIGKQKKSLIVLANGKHVLSDCVTTAVALVGVAGAYLTGILLIDLAVALLGGCYIMWEGFKLIRLSVAGLLDKAEPEVDGIIRNVLSDESDEHGWEYHELRHRSEGDRHWIEVHLIFKDGASLQDAHDHATHLEAKLQEQFDEPVTITTHLEPVSHRHKDAIS